MLQRELDRGPQEVELVADVVPAVGEREAVQRLAHEQQRHRVGQLDLTAAAGLDPVDALEDLRSEHVAAHHRQVRRRLLGRGLLDETGDAHERRSVLERLGRDAAVRRDLLGRERLQGHHRGVHPLARRDHVGEHVRALDHQVVAEQDGERLVTHVAASDATA